MLSPRAREIIHFSGQTMRIGPLRRQRCLWCGGLIQEYDLRRISRVLEPGEDPDAEWEPGAYSGLVAVDGQSSWAVDDPEDGKVPARACSELLPDAPPPPDEGDSVWDRAVDAVMAELHAPEEYAARAVRAVREAWTS